MSIQLLPIVMFRPDFSTIGYLTARWAEGEKSISSLERRYKFEVHKEEEGPIVLGCPSMPKATYPPRLVLAMDGSQGQVPLLASSLIHEAFAARLSRKADHVLANESGTLQEYWQVTLKGLDDSTLDVCFQFEHELSLLLHLYRQQLAYAVSAQLTHQHSQITYELAARMRVQPATPS